MTSHRAAQRRPGAFLIASLFALASFAGLAATPANAQIDPGMLPVTGTWTHGANDTVAWVDLATWTLVTEVKGAPISTRFDPEPDPWFPVAGDWDGDGVDSIQMFNVHTWEVVPAEKGPLVSADDPEPCPWVPVAGDWDGRGVDTIRVFDQRDGSLHRLEEGPIKVDRYDPEPDPWHPVAGDWDGDRIDTLATYQRQEPRDGKAVWTILSGDWDGDGIDTDAAVYLPSGELVFPDKEETTLRSVAGSKPNGLGSIFAPSGGGGTCYKTITDWSQSIKIFHYGVGGCFVIVTTMWIEWTCCKITQDGSSYGCGGQLKMNIHTAGYSNC